MSLAAISAKRNPEGTALRATVEAITSFGNYQANRLKTNQVTCPRRANKV